MTGGGIGEHSCGDVQTSHPQGEIFAVLRQRKQTVGFCKDGSWVKTSDCFRQIVLTQKTHQRDRPQGCRDSVTRRVENV